MCWEQDRSMGEKRPRLCRQSERCKAEIPSEVGNRKGQRKCSSEGTSEERNYLVKGAGRRAGSSGGLGQTLLRNDGKLQWVQMRQQGDTREPCSKISSVIPSAAPE